MDWVPREEFVPPELLDLAYDDRAMPIRLEQTISQPYTVAFMCQEARLASTDKVLEIGTGSGYGAAVLSLLAREVHTIERIEELYRDAASAWTDWVTAMCTCIWTMVRGAAGRSAVRRHRLHRRCRGLAAWRTTISSQMAAG